MFKMNAFTPTLLHIVVLVRKAVVEALPRLCKGGYHVIPLASKKLIS